jgi:hypothetical protein
VQFIAEFVGDEWEEMRSVFYRSMRAIEHALSARREYLTNDGQIMQGSPDHYAPLAATKYFRDFLMANPLGLLVSPRCPVVSHPLRYYPTFRGRHTLAATSRQGLRLLRLPQRFEVLNDFT